MYKIGSCVQEVVRSVEKNLIDNQIENKYGFSKLAQATDYLSAAAELFEKAGMIEEAEEIVSIIKGITRA